jgi:SAM-dependent methyltransferase
MSYAARVNEEQIAYWSGPAAQRWIAQQATVDRALEPYGAALLDAAALRGGEHVLDVGCGCGATSLSFAERVGPTGIVLGIDISAPMLARAAERGRNRVNVRFQEGDAATMKLDPEYDGVVSRFGVMFFEDPVVAFTNLRTALRAGTGQLAFVAWRAFAENAWTALPVAALGDDLGVSFEPMDPDLPGPNAFADPDKVARILKSAGYSAIALDRFDADVMFGESLDAAADFPFQLGPVSRLLAGAPAEVVARARERVRRALEPHQSAGGVALPGASWLVTARA